MNYFWNIYLMVLRYLKTVWVMYLLSIMIWWMLIRMFCFNWPIQINGNKGRRFFSTKRGWINRSQSSLFIHPLSVQVNFYFFKIFAYFFSRRHLSEQYFTSSQTFSHFFRHVKGRPQVMQVLVGRSDFFCIFIFQWLINGFTFGIKTLLYHKLLP